MAAKWVAMINHNRVTTVVAENREQAEREVARVLDRPGRHQIYRDWVASGRRLIQE